MTRKQKIKQLATRELTNTNPFNNHLTQAALVASFIILTALGSFTIGYNDAIDYNDVEDDYFGVTSGC